MESNFINQSIIRTVLIFGRTVVPVPVPVGGGAAHVLSCLSIHICFCFLLLILILVVADVDEMAHDYRSLVSNNNSSNNLFYSILLYNLSIN
mmetsp:Transcript_62600/g.69986  ORF Transcript_62600/g.69986 Transcript_62600/m.69986 type:complete len:92 (+) Transcript_62600:789-1064(+)